MFVQCSLHSLALRLRMHSWEPWDRGPRLRKTSWTAKQLLHLTPREVYLESRRIHIGDFPPKWVETHSIDYFNEIETQLSKLENGEKNEKELQRLRRSVLCARQITELRKRQENNTVKLLQKTKRMKIQQKRRRELFRRDMQKLHMWDNIEDARDEVRVHELTDDSDCDSLHSTLESSTLSKVTPSQAMDDDIKPLSIPASSLPPASTTHTFEPPKEHLYDKLKNRHVRHSKKIYQGRFLVQERKSRTLNPKVSETLLPLETSLASGWREYAVLAKITKDPARPLVLYFYDCFKRRKLQRKARRRWNRSLKYKVTITSEFQMSVFSPLDFTIAIWKPRLYDRKKVNRQRRKEQRRNLRRYSKYLNQPNEQSVVKHPWLHIRSEMNKRKNQTKMRDNDDGDEKSKHTHIMLIHAVKLPNIMDLAYLIANATGYAQMLAKPNKLSVEIPAVDAITQVQVRGTKDEEEYLRMLMNMLENPANISVNEFTIAYKDLLSPTVSTSKDLQQLKTKIHSVSKLASKRLLSATDPVTGVMDYRKKKVALAYIIQLNQSTPNGGIGGSVPLWLSSFDAHVFPITRLDLMLKNVAKLVMLNPVPRCFEGEKEEPTPVEGFCDNVHVSTGSVLGSLKYSSRAFILVEDHYLLHMSASDAEPSMYASGNDSMVKDITPYPLEVMCEHDAVDDLSDGATVVSEYRSAQTSFGESPPSADTMTTKVDDPKSAAIPLEQNIDEIETISWISRSTCLQEIDFHDQKARLEFKRRCRQIERAHGVIDLLHIDEVFVEGNTVKIVYGGQCRMLHLDFSQPDIAHVWKNKLKETSEYWRAKRKAELIRQATNTETDYQITPLLQNRAIVFSGQLFMKHHLFTSFKPYLVILTPNKLLIFRTRQPHAPTWDLEHKVPAVVLHQKKYLEIDLTDVYVYTGQAAAQCIGINNDSFTDAANPGSRALPRTYEDGSISTETELERCFVVRNTKITYAFLARSRVIRDRWSTSIRYAASQSDSFDPLDEVDFSK